jgi:hypothetical protein
VTLFIFLVVLVTLVGVVPCALIGSRVASRRRIPRTAAIAIVLALGVFVAAVLALAIGGPQPDSTCDGGSGSLRNDIAAVIAVGAIPSLAVAIVLALAAVVVSIRSWKLWASALAVCVAAGIIDVIALTQSVHICLE